MALLLDVFGFLSVVLRGLVLTAQSLTIGGIVFLALLAYPLRRELGSVGAAAVEVGGGHMDVTVWRDGSCEHVVRKH